MAVGKLSYNLFYLRMVLLRVAFLHWSVRRSLCSDLNPSLTLRPTSLLLDTINSSNTQAITIRCSTSTNDAAKATEITGLKLTHKQYGSQDTNDMLIATSTNKIPSLSAYFSNQRSKFTPSGKISPTLNAPSVISILILPNLATCYDSALFTCILNYKDLGGNNMQTEDSSFLDVAPTEIHVKLTPNKTITVGMKLKLDCEGIVGTVEFAEPAKLVWAYTNRESAIQNQYNALDKEMESFLKRGPPMIVSCSKKEFVTLEFTVDEVRDSMRDYYCVVARRYVVGSEISYVGRGSNKISIPDFSKAKEKPLGIGGLIGIALAGMALLCLAVFLVFWVKRREKKKKDRKEEVDTRKSQIDERRKSIATHIQQKQGPSETEVTKTTDEPESEAATETEEATEETEATEATETTETESTAAD